MRWTVAEARKRFAELLRAASERPQPVFRRGRLAAVVVDADTFREFVDWQTRYADVTVADAFEELRALLAEEAYELQVPERVDRTNLFAELLDELAV